MEILIRGRFKAPTPVEEAFAKAKLAAMRRRDRIALIERGLPAPPRVRRSGNPSGRRPAPPQTLTVDGRLFGNIAWVAEHFSATKAEMYQIGLRRPIDRVRGPDDAIYLDVQAIADVLPKIHRRKRRRAT